MRNSSSSQKNSDKHSSEEFIHTWLVRAAKAILTVILTGLVGIGTGIYQDVKALQTEDKLNKQTINEQETKIKGLGTKLEAQAKQINDIHWFLIQRNNVKVPLETDKNAK